MGVNPKLSSLAKEWKSAEAISSSYSNVPEGDYTAQLKEMLLGDSKAGHLQVVSTYEIVDGEYEGQTVKRFDRMVDRTSMGYFKGLCEIIGMEIPDDIETLQESMDAFVSNCTDLFNIHIKQTDGEDGKTYSNLYVNGISDLVIGEEGQEVEVAQEVVEEIAEEVAEEVVEEIEEEPQQITAPIKRYTAKPATVPKVTQTKPAQKVTTATAPKQSIQRVPAPVPAPVRKTITAKR